MIHVGVDLHQRFCYTTALEARGKKADRETQARRQQVRLRATLVRQRTRLKNQVHAVLHQQGLRSPVTDLFGKRGRLWLNAVKLPAQARESVNVCLRLLDGYREEIQKQNLPLSEKAKQDKRVGWLLTIPGIGECSAMMLLAEMERSDDFTTQTRCAVTPGWCRGCKNTCGQVRLFS